MENIWASPNVDINEQCLLVLISSIIREDSSASGAAGRYLSIYYPSRPRYVFRSKGPLSNVGEARRFMAGCHPHGCLALPAWVRTARKGPMIAVNNVC